MASVFRDITNTISEIPRTKLFNSKSLLQAKIENPFSSRHYSEPIVYKSNEVLSDYSSDNSNSNNEIDENMTTGSNMNSPSSNSNKTTSTGTVESQNSTHLGSLKLTFLKGRVFNQIELVKLCNFITADPHKTKFVRISFRRCERMDDTDLANIGAAVGSKLRSVEYLSLNFGTMRGASVWGIQRLIGAISGPKNSIKALRIRVKNLKNEHVRKLINEIKTYLVNLEELNVIITGNSLSTHKGVRDLKEDLSLAKGLKNFDIRHEKLSVLNFVKGQESKDMIKYILERFGKIGASEGMLVKNKMTVFNKIFIKRKTSHNKIALESSFEAKNI